MLNSILVILCLIAVSAFFSMSEISLAASRKIKLKLLADEGNINAQRVLNMQENPGMFFTVVQIGLNAVAILGGIVGDAAFSPAFHSLFSRYMSAELSEQLSFILSFSLVTGMFILFADLTPKRIGMIAPEAVALRIINPMRFCLYVCTPLVWFFNGLANIIFRIFKLPMVRKDDITSDDIYAVVEAGALAGVLRKQEHELIENVFELESRTVPSSMTPRENVIWFDLHEDEQSLKNKVAEHPHSKFLVCNEDIDHIIGYVDSKDLLNRVLANQSLALNSGVQIRNTLIVPDTLTLSEALESFKTAGEDFAVIMNEYALVVGIITLNDVMTTLMGDLVGQGLEEQIKASGGDIAVETMKGITAAFSDQAALTAITGTTEDMWTVIGTQVARSAQFSDMAQIVADSSGPQFPEGLQSGIDSQKIKTEQTIGQYYRQVGNEIKRQFLQPFTVDIKLDSVISDGGIRRNVGAPYRDPAGKKPAHYASGGLIEKPTLSYFAEESPEMAIPIDGSRNATELWKETGRLLGLYQENNYGVYSKAFSGAPATSSGFQGQTAALPTYSPVFNLYGSAGREEVEDAEQASFERFKEWFLRFEESRSRMSF